MPPAAHPFDLDYPLISCSTSTSLTRNIELWLNHAILVVCCGADVLVEMVRCWWCWTTTSSTPAGRRRRRNPGVNELVVLSLSSLQPRPRRRPDGVRDCNPGVDCFYCCNCNVS
jgi:hypothetical protein